MVTDIKKLLWKATAVGGLLLLFGALCLSQEVKPKVDAKVRPDFSGLWELYQTEDTRGRTNPPSSPREITLMVICEGPQIKFISNSGKESIRELTYYADGRGEENPSEVSIILNGRGDGSEQSTEILKSKTKWDGDKLASRANVRRVVSGRIVNLEIVREWKLSKDGETLTFTTRTRFQSAAMASESKKIYRRATHERPR